MLGALWLFELDLDPGSLNLLVSLEYSQLDFRRHWICLQCCVPAQELVSYLKCNG